MKDYMTLFSFLYSHKIIFSFFLSLFIFVLYRKWREALLSLSVLMFLPYVLSLFFLSKYLVFLWSNLRFPGVCKVNNLLFSRLGPRSLCPVHPRSQFWRYGCFGANYSNKCPKREIQTDVFDMHRETTESFSRPRCGDML